MTDSGGRDAVGMARRRGRTPRATLARLADSAAAHQAPKKTAKLAAIVPAGAGRGRGVRRSVEAEARTVVVVEPRRIAVEREYLGGAAAGADAAGVDPHDPVAHRGDLVVFVRHDEERAGLPEALHKAQAFL